MLLMSLLVLFTWFILKYLSSDDAPGTRAAILLPTNILGPACGDLIYVMSALQTLKSDTFEAESQING